jgi:Chromate resistance exported protein
VALLARIVHGAHIPADLASTPQSAGLRAIADEFAALGLDDQRQLELELPVYDALYAWCQRHTAITPFSELRGRPEYAADQRYGMSSLTPADPEVEGWPRCDGLLPRATI